MTQKQIILMMIEIKPNKFNVREDSRHYTGHGFGVRFDLK